jgi:predicted DNA-binding protein
MVERDRRLSIRIGDEEWQMLYALAEREGISASDYIRLFIRRTYAEAFGSAKPKKR